MLSTHLNHSSLPIYESAKIRNTAECTVKIFQIHHVPTHVNQLAYLVWAELQFGLVVAVLPATGVKHVIHKHVQTSTGSGRCYRLR